MSERDRLIRELERVAGLARTAPTETIALARRLSQTADLRFDSGFVAGLLHAVELLERHSASAADILRETASTAAKVVLRRETQLAAMRKEVGSPEALAELEAVGARLRAGEVIGVPVMDTLRELEERDKAAALNGQPTGVAPEV